MMRRLAALLLAFAVAVPAAAAPVPRAYFGLHLHAADQGTAWPAVPFGAWRLWDAHVSWKDLEPEPGRWDFERLDRYVAMAGLTRTELLLPLALTPRWASSRPDEPSAYGPGHAAEPRELADWVRHVEIIARRYRGRIAAYEIWNEPNAEGFFSGDAAAMVRLVCAAHAAIKAADPQAIVVSPAATHGLAGAEWLDRFLAAGGTPCTDAIGFHYYTQAHESPEAMLPLVARVRSVMARHGLSGRPLWNTEAGWYLRNANRPLTVRWHALDEPTSVAYVTRALLLGRALGMERFFWYAWDDGNLGLLELEDGSLKPAARAYAATAGWLTGADALRCDTSEPRLVRCEFDREGRHWRVLWSRIGDVRFVPPASWRTVAVETMLGARLAHAGTAALSVGAVPILLEESAP